jgi:CDGSH-type Zn-finger protein
MSRLIDHDATGPLKLDESDLDPEKGDVAVCLCGLSESYPYCDGSHRAVADEAETQCYRYVETDEGDREAKRVAAIRFADGTTEPVGEEPDE